MGTNQPTDSLMEAIEEADKLLQGHIGELTLGEAHAIVRATLADCRARQPPPTLARRSLDEAGEDTRDE